MMTPNSDNKAGARAHRTFRNNEEYYEIRGQRCYYSANEYLPSAPILPYRGNEKFTHHPSSDCAKTQVLYLRAVALRLFSAANRFTDIQNEYLIFEVKSCNYMR